MYPRLFQLGHIAIPTYGALTSLGLLAGLGLAFSLARRLGLNPDRVWSLCITGILATLVGARLLIVAAYFSAFRQHPFWVLGITHLRDAWIMPAAMFIGGAAALLYALAAGLPVLRVMDCLAPAAALSLAIERFGAFLAGVDYGIAVSAPWTVTYRNPLAQLWYGTPLGAAVEPVQLYQAVAWLLVFAVLFAGAGRIRSGRVAGAWLFACGVIPFFAGMLRAEPAPFALSLGLGAACVVAGGALLLDRRYTSTDATPTL
ncbi:prolipoprotein diacylglyceryl transferase family protein [Silvibacterium acidisoli]|uniref:prolipoprotein diacylglyceryl transferase family protein n=1 Tax=Acidobacteriaceae bacterium ZG23-2 TaxID=2883246 RepID=UPI00406BE62C